MNNVWRLFRFDLGRLKANVMSIIIALGLVLVPSLFAWYNIIACWNVFDNTGNLPVAVANTDEGYQSDLIPLRINIGDQVVSALRANDQIDWQFTDENDAIDGARSGRYYAAVVIPKSFSRDMLTFYTGDAGHADIVYYANEKKSAIAPKITDHLCDECLEHYGAVKALLDGAGVAYEEDYRLVRGLDYYTRTVFEVQVDNGMSAQNAIGGGGRYDKLAEEVGGRPTPGLGFALGFERCVLALEAAGVELPRAQKCDLFVACVDDSVRARAFVLVQECRDAGFTTEMDHQKRSLKSQFKLADKLGAARGAVLGPDELAEGVVTLRDMATHAEAKVRLEEVVGELGRAIL